MRYAATEKLEIIWTVEDSSIGIAQTLKQLSIPKSKFYRWYDGYLWVCVSNSYFKRP